MRTCKPALVLLLAAACAQGASQEVTYRIARVNGQSLPFTLREEGNCVHWLLEGFINFPGDRTYSSTFNIHIVCPGVEPRPVDDPGIAGTVLSSNDTVYFRNADNVVTGHGIINSDSLVVQGSVHKLTYMRIRDGS